MSRFSYCNRGVQSIITFVALFCHCEDTFVNSHHLVFCLETGLGLRYFHPFPCLASSLIYSLVSRGLASVFIIQHPLSSTRCLFSWLSTFHWNPYPVVVSIAVSKLGCAGLIFIEPEVNVSSSYYRDEQLQRVLPTIRLLRSPLSNVRVYHINSYSYFSSQK